MLKNAFFENLVKSQPLNCSYFVSASELFIFCFSLIVLILFQPRFVLILFQPRFVLILFQPHCSYEIILISKECEVVID